MRHSKQPKEPNESWVSSRYPIEGMHWRDLQRLYLPEINQNWGQACSSLKKLWKSYKIAGRNGESRSWQAWKINRIQSAMGLELSTFPELQGMGYDEELEETSNEDQELTADEVAAKREEEDEDGGLESNLNYPNGTSESEEEEWSAEDKELLKEEIEAEKENDDW